MSKRTPTRLSEIGCLIGAALGETYGHLGASGVETVGPPLVIYYGVPVGDEPFEVEICAPVMRAADAPAGWRFQELPAGSFATVLHIGPYDSIGPVYRNLLAWLAEHHLDVMGPPREVYLSPGDTPPEQIRTVIEYPIADTAALDATS
jgi:effector-binding domain-containing protein